MLDRSPCPSVGEVTSHRCISEIAAANLGKFWAEHKWRVNTATPKSSLNSWAEEFFFCLLGGYGITYENNKVAFDLLKERGFLERKWFASQQEPEFEIARVLSTRLPQVDQGSAIPFFYRFPNSKAKTLCKAARWLEEYLSWNFIELQRSNAAYARQLLLGCPGMGYKTSSWFLRNVGNGDGLAIIDVHIERICKQWAIFPYGLYPQKDYLEMEQRLVRICQSINVSVETIDLVLWQFARGDFNKQ